MPDDPIRLECKFYIPVSGGDALPERIHEFQRYARALLTSEQARMQLYAELN